MNRQNASSTILLALLICLFAWGQTTTAGSIEYINPKVPTVQLPKYEGQRYEAVVPDTLDLAERAALGVNGLTRTLDPRADYELYWVAGFHRNPPIMSHDFNDHVQIKFHEALPLLRLASGSRQNEEVDKRWMEVILEMQGPDGLLYYPRTGRPWATAGVPVEQFGPMPAGDHYSEPYANGRLLGAIALYYKTTGDDRWKEAGKRIVDGLAKQAVHRDDYAYFSKGLFDVREVSDAKAPLPDPWTRMTFGWITIGLAQFYTITGYEPALALSGKIARFTRYHGGMFEADGRFVGIALHFHGHLHPLLGMLEYGIAAKDREMIEFARKGYEFGVGNMNPIVGYVPEVISPTATSEICGVADMIHMGVKLSLAGNVATLTFPIFERTDKVHIQNKDYTLIRKGNDVVRIDPPGRHCPLYQREKYRDDKVHTKKTTRFVANQQIDW